MGNITFNPAVTLSPQNNFLLQTQGYVQGLMFDDDVPLRFIETGVLGSSVSGEVYAGTGITLSIAAIDGESMGNTITVATSEANLDGFVVGNKLYNGIIVPGNSVPAVVAGQTASVIKFGTNARLAVQCDPTLAASLVGEGINQQVAWDFTNQKLIAYTTGTALPVKVLSINNNSKTVNTSGGLSWTTGTCAIIQI